MMPKPALAALAAALRHRAAGVIAAGCAIVLAAVASGVPAHAAPPPGTLVDAPCDIDVADPAVAGRMRCARLHVLRDPARPEAGRFEIAVAIRRSAAPKPGAAPVLFLHGGPGGEFTRWVGMGGRDPAPGHDLVAFDMRGGGRSTPRVCDGAGAALMQAFVDADGPAAAASRRQAIANECLREWRAAGFEGTHFGTAANVADAEALREALGVARWRLLGESYGTTVAAHYVATHPDRIEAAVLDSLYPPDELVLPVAEMQARLVDRIGADCARDPDCAARFPDVGRATLAAAVADLDREPLHVGRGAGARLLDGLALQRLVALAAADEAGARAIPFLLDAARRRDARYFEGAVAATGSDSDGGVSLAALLATDCRDRARHHVEGEGDGTLRLLAGLPSGTCAAWTAPGEAPRWPWGTQVPILLLAGGYDSFQPDATAIGARIGPAAHVVEVSFAAHGARGAGPCVRDIASGWLADPTRAPDVACLASMDAPPFLREVVPLAGVAALASAATPSPWVFLLAAALGMALLAGLGAPLVARLRRRPITKPVAPRAAALASVLLLLAVAVPAIALASAGSAMRAIGLFGLPAPAGHAAWLLWPAALLAVVALVAALRDRRFAAGSALVAVLVVVGAAAWLGLLPMP
jgi:pimeloyl-ACP methyl ester carboxylesterase